MAQSGQDDVGLLLDDIANDGPALKTPLVKCCFCWGVGGGGGAHRQTDKSIPANNEALSLVSLVTLPNVNTRGTLYHIISLHQ